MDKNRAGDAIKIDILCKKRSQVLNEITTLWFNQLNYVLLDKALFPNTLQQVFETILLTITQSFSVFQKLVLSSPTHI